MHPNQVRQQQRTSHTICLTAGWMAATMAFTGLSRWAKSLHVFVRQCSQQADEQAQQLPYISCAASETTAAVAVNRIGIAVAQPLHSDSMAREGTESMLSAHRKEAVHTNGDLIAAQHPNKKLKSNPSD